MTNIEYFKHDASVGDLVSIELTTGKSISGKVIEISDYIVVEKEDGKHMRILDGIIGAWEVLKKNEEITYDLIEENNHTDVSNSVSSIQGIEELVGKEGELENEETDDEDEEDTDAEEQSYIASVINSSEASLVSWASMDKVKDEVREAFNHYWVKAGVEDNQDTPTNATIKQYDSLRMSALLDNGNTIRFTRGTLIGYNLIRDNLIGKRIFCGANGDPGRITKSKRNLVRMSYGELKVVFLNALEQSNYGLMRRILRTIQKFPNFARCVSEFKALLSCLVGLKTISSIQICSSSLSASQKQDVRTIVSDSLKSNDAAGRNRQMMIRSQILTKLGLKLTKAYISYVMADILRSSIVDTQTGLEPRHASDSSPNNWVGSSNLDNEKDNYNNDKDEHVLAQTKDSLLEDFKKVFESLPISLDAIIPTNATLANEGIGGGIKAITDDGKELIIQGEFYIGNPFSLLSNKVRVFTKPQPSGKCFITIEEMSYGKLIDYCRERDDDSFYQDLSNVIRGLRSIPVFAAQNDHLKAIYNRAKQGIKASQNKKIKSYSELSKDEINIITSFVKDAVSKEDPLNPVSDIQIINAYNNQFGVLLHTSVISTIRKDIGIPDQEKRISDAAPIQINSNCVIDKYFTWYNNGAARNDTYPEIRFKDDVVDPLLLLELKQFRKGDAPIPAVCGVVVEGRYVVASFVVKPGLSSDVYKIASLFETAGNPSAADAIKEYISNLREQEKTNKEAPYQVLYTRARSLRLSHDYLGAEELFQDLIKAEYQLDTVVKDLADMYREMGNLPKSISLMEKHIDDLGNKQKAYNFISNLYTAAGDYHHSLEYLKKAYDLTDTQDKNSRIRYLTTIANQYIILKDTETAKTVLSEALTIKQDSKLKALLDRLTGEKNLKIGKLQRVLSFKAPALLESDLGLANFQQLSLSDKAANLLLQSKQYQENQDQERCRMELLSYAKTRYLDLLKSDKISSAQEYMHAAQSICNTTVDTSGMLLLLSQLVKDPIELAETELSLDFASFLKAYDPAPSCERVLYLFLRCFTSECVPQVLNLLYDNEAWRKWIDGLLGRSISDKRVFRETLIKKAETHESTYKDICTSLQEIKLLDDSYEMSKRVVRLFERNYTISLSDYDNAALSKLLETIQQLNDIRKLDDYQIVEDRTLLLQRNTKILMNSFISEPTRLSVLYVMPVLEKSLFLLTENLDRMGHEKAPELSLVAVTNARNNDGWCSIQLKIENKAGHAKVISASVRIVKINGRDTLEKQYAYNDRTPLYGGDSHNFEITVSVNQGDIERRVLSLDFQVIYYDKDSQSHTVSLPVETRIDESKDFKPYKNEFLKYANGQEVQDSKMVKGRDDLIQRIADTALNDRKSFIIHGQRRSGKSTVLFHVGNRLKSTKRCFVVSMSMLSLSGEDNPIVNEQSFLGDLYFEILSKISRQIKLENKTKYKELFGYGLDCKDFLRNPNAMFTSYMDKIKDVIHDDLGYAEDRIILIIDEFTALYSEILAGTISDSFIKKMKELSESGSVTFILSGHDVMPVFWERFPNEFGIFKKEPITSIDEESARSLVEEPVWDIENNVSRFEKDAVTRIIKLSGYNPFYIQIICAEVVDYANRNRIPIITEYDVNKVINQMTSSEAKLRAGDFDNLVPIGDNKLFHEKVFQLSLDDVRLIVKEIAQYERDYVPTSSLHSVSEDKKNKVLSYLITRNVLEPHPEYGRESLKIKVSLFKEWLRKNE